MYLNNNKLVLILVAMLLSSCSGIKSVNSKQKNNAKQLVEQKTIEFEMIRGEMKKLSFSYKRLEEDSSFSCRGKDIPFILDGIKFTAYLAESYFSEMKNYQCHIKNEEGQNYIVVNIKVKDRKFPSEKLRVDRKRIVLSKKDQKRVAKEQKFLNSRYLSSIKRPLFGNEFKIPLKSKITSHYGVRRLYNNVKKGQHLGIDFRAKVGTPIPTSNDGRVVVGRDLFYTGNTVIVDHGLGIFTVYGHLSKVNVNEGDLVKKGDVVGLAGATGRVTGPHLHWGVKVHGNWIDGKSLVLLR